MALRRSACFLCIGVLAALAAAASPGGPRARARARRQGPRARRPPGAGDEPPSAAAGRRRARAAGADRRPPAHGDRRAQAHGGRRGDGRADLPGPPRRLRERQAHRAQAQGHPAGRARRRRAHARGHRGARRPHGLAKRPAVADARAQPPVVDDRAAARLRPARRLRRLRARLAVLPRPGDPAPAAGELRQAQRALAGQGLRRPDGGDARRDARPRRQRGDGVAWEYYFTFDGGRPPWISSLSQGTGLQALARAATRLHRRRRLPVTTAACSSSARRRRPACASPAAPAPTTCSTARPAPVHPQRLHPVAERARRLRRADERPGGAGSLQGRRRGRAGEVPTSTPAPGRCTRAATTRTSPTSATTSCCATS